VVSADLLGHHLLQKGAARREDPNFMLYQTNKDITVPKIADYSERHLILLQGICFFIGFHTLCFL
jgi:hypothetical protein